MHNFEEPQPEIGSAPTPFSIAEDLMDVDSIPESARKKNNMDRSGVSNIQDIF